jgi:toxin secretion/phage lysis holin
LIKEYASTIYTAAVGTTGKETAIGGIVAAVGLAVSDWLGGWDNALQLLLLLMAIDYATGVLGAWKTKTLNSDVMFWGGVRKAVVLFVIGLASLMDAWIQPGSPVFRTTAIFFYVTREGLSVTENLGVLNVPLPATIRDKLQQLNNSQDGGSK